jgi:protoheme IX farnesyltransferase
LADFWSLIKFRQTALLLVTGFCGYLIGRGWPVPPNEGLGMLAGLFLAIAGCTALNMVLDRGVDARMERTASRPLPAGRIRPAWAAAFGIALTPVGLGVCLALDWRFGAIVTLGVAFDLLVYTAWLKRRSALSILFGGVAGGMPVLAGRVLGLGHLDLVGVLLAASVLLWIPAHILTLALRYAADYRAAGVPVWPNRYGARSTRLIVAAANLLNALVLIACGLLLGIHPAALALLLTSGAAMVVLSLVQLIRPTDRRNWLLFKAASVYMLLSSLLLTIGELV